MGRELETLPRLRSVRFLRFSELTKDPTDWCKNGCGISFHKECIQQWRKYHGNECPLCRAPWGTPQPPGAAGGLETGCTACLFCSEWFGGDGYGCGVVR